LVPLESHDGLFAERGGAFSDRQYVYVESERTSARIFDEAEATRLQIGRRAEMHEEARTLITELRRAHDEIVSDLERRIDEATARGVNPLRGH
jgi:hypothetical protein